MEDNYSSNDQSNEAEQSTPQQEQTVQTQVSQDSRNLGMLCHLLGLLTSFIGPLILWLIKKDDDPFVDDQGKEALNWQITLAIAFFAASITCVLAPFLIPVVAILDLIFSIIACIKSSNGEKYRYPICLRLIK